METAFCCNCYVPISYVSFEKILATGGWVYCDDCLMKGFKDGSYETHCKRICLLCDKAIATNTRGILGCHAPCYYWYVSRIREVLGDELWREPQREE